KDPGKHYLKRFKGRPMRVRIDYKAIGKSLLKD
ncbi:hypothetical protein LCGC14_2270790, partial [marine sediment metagenome]